MIQLMREHNLNWAKAFLSIGITFLFFGCGKSRPPELSEYQHIHEAAANTEPEAQFTNAEVAKTIRQLISAEGRNASIYQELKNSVSKPADEELAKLLNEADVIFLDQQKKEVFYPTQQNGLLSEVKFIRFKVSFEKIGNYSVSFLLPVVEIKPGFKKTLSSEQAYNNNIYKAQVQCPESPTNLNCSTLTSIITQSPRSDQTNPALIKNIGLLFSYGQMYVNTSRALLKPENIHPLTKRLIERNYKDPVLHKLISVPFGISQSQLDFSIEQGEKLQIRAPRKRELDQSKGEVLFGKVWLSSDVTGIKISVGQAELAGLEYLPNLEKEFGDFSITIDFNKYNTEIANEETVQVSASSSVETIEKERAEQNNEGPIIDEPLYLEQLEKPYYISPDAQNADAVDNSEERGDTPNDTPQPESDDRESDHGENNNPGTPKPLPTPPAPLPNPDSVEEIGNYVDQFAVSPQGKLNSNIFGINFNKEKDTNRFIQRRNVLKLKNNNYIKNYINILTGEGGYTYCQSQQKNIARFRCQQLKDKSACAAEYGKGNVNYRDSAQQHLNSMARLNMSKEVRDIFEYFDVSPITQNILYVESRYSKSGDFEIESNGGTPGKSNTCTSSALGPHQLVNSTSAELAIEDLIELGSLTNYEASQLSNKCKNWFLCDELSTLYNLYPTPRTHTEGNSCKISYNNKDARTYYAPATKMITRMNKQALRTFSNNIEYLYWAYHNGQGGTQSAIEDAVPEASAETALRIVSMCSNESSYEATRACYTNKARAYGVSSLAINPTRLFNLSLNKFIDNYNGAHTCTVIEGTLKFLALSIISLSPEDYGFQINPTKASNSELRMFHPTMSYSPN